ncbi:unnamed protein product, partial [Ectocarpus fasciculatus]
VPEGKAVLPADRESRCGRYRGRVSIMTSKGGKMTSKSENNDNNNSSVVAGGLSRTAKPTVV